MTNNLPVTPASYYSTVKVLDRIIKQERWRLWNKSSEKVVKISILVILKKLIVLGHKLVCLTFASLQDLHLSFRFVRRGSRLWRDMRVVRLDATPDADSLHSWMWIRETCILCLVLNKVVFALGDDVKVSWSEVEVIVLLLELPLMMSNFTVISIHCLFIATWQGSHAGLNLQ